MYSYKGETDLSSQELYLTIVIDKTMEQLGVDDLLAATAIVSGQPILKTRGKFSGATKGTSIASKYASQYLPYKSAIRLPTITGASVSTLKIAFTKNIGRFVGRAIPILGWIILAADVINIFYKSQYTYNQIVDYSDMLVE
ncbi:STM2901 family protein [Psychromonas sp. PT13]|uniref:STM2901 family protein n=1 Tax=Psychromonas sp. PT13 TaxID=3439547 RepID=UPI003EBF2263